MTRDFIGDGCFNYLVFFQKFLVMIAIMSMTPEIPSRGGMYLYFYKKYAITIRLVVSLQYCFSLYIGNYSLTQEEKFSHPLQPCYPRPTISGMQRLHIARHKNKIEANKTHCRYHTTEAASLS